MTLVLAYLAGLLTLLNPCVVPVLPIVLASATTRDRRGPLFLMAGMSGSFVILGVLLARLGPSVGVTPESVSAAAALAMAGFGLILLLPALGTRFASATAGLANTADSGMNRLDLSAPGGLFAGGALLGAVWSPCIGPTLGGAIALAATGESLATAAAIMLAFAAGVSSVMLGLAYGTRSGLTRYQSTLRRLAGRTKPVLGATFVATGLALWFGLHQRLEGWVLDTLPEWFNDLSILI